MKPIIGAEMIEATRLTRAGRLTEATALLRGMLQGKEPDGSSPEARPAGEVPAGVLGLTPTRQAEHDATTTAAQPMMPEGMLRDFLTKIRGLGASSGLLGPGDPAPNIPPVVLPPGGRFVTASYSNHAGTRGYRLYVPSAYHGQPLPLLVMLHGCTQSPDDFAAGTRMNAVGEEHDCFVAYPAQCPAANQSKCWNWFNPGDQRRDQGEPSLVAGIVRQITSAYAIDSRRVYIAGLSAGGAAAAVLAETYPDIFAAAGVHSGLAPGAASDVPSAFAAMRAGGSEVSGRSARAPGPGSNRTLVPTIVFHGDKDVTVHPRNGAQVIEQSAPSTHSDLRSKTERGQAGGRTYSRTMHFDPSGDAVLEMWVVHGGGHAWSGGSPAGSFTDPRGPDASREMVRFFLAHPKTEGRPS